MQILDGAQAVRNALNTSSNTPGLCLNWVDGYYGHPHSNIPGLYPVPNAIDGWTHSSSQHTDAANAPAGVPVYFTPTANPAGHIVLSLGNGLCRSTDWPSSGVTSTVGIQHLADVRGKPALGWTEDYLGNPISGIGSVTPSPSYGGTISTTQAIKLLEVVPMLEITYVSESGNIARGIMHQAGIQLKVDDPATAGDDSIWATIVGNNINAPLGLKPDSILFRGNDLHATRQLLADYAREFKRVSEGGTQDYSGE